MNFKVVFKENNNSFNANFKQVQQITDGGYNKGYNEGYDKGYQTGYGESYNKGFDEGFIDGKQAEYDRFWDIVQENGNRTDYKYAFSSSSWNDKTFKPKYDIILQGSGTASYVFVNSNITNLKKILEDCGVVLSTVGITNNINTFGNSTITVLPEINMSNTNNLSTFQSAEKLQTVDKFIIGDIEHTFKNTFYSCKSLIHCPFEGVIRNSGLDMSACTLLDKESLTSVINCLSTTTSGLSVTLSKQAVDKAFETNEGANNGSNSTEWTTLVNTKSNWTINLS